MAVKQPMQGGNRTRAKILDYTYCHFVLTVYK